jgi:hypothetical protein
MVLLLLLLEQQIEVEVVEELAIKVVLERVEVPE